jgi:hypothetical protein
MKSVLKMKLFWVLVMFPFIAAISGCGLDEYGKDSYYQMRKKQIGEDTDSLLREMKEIFGRISLSNKASPDKRSEYLRQAILKHGNDGKMLCENHAINLYYERNAPKVDIANQIVVHCEKQNVRVTEAFISATKSTKPVDWLIATVGDWWFDLKGLIAEERKSAAFNSAIKTVNVRRHFID